MNGYNKKDALSFQNIYVTYSSKLIRFAQEYVISKADAENIVHDVFIDLWNRWHILSPLDNPFGYLYIAVKNRALNYLKTITKERKITGSISEEYLEELTLNYESLSAFDKNFNSIQEVYDALDNALNNLPEKCRIIFVKSKIEGLKQQEIAKQLGISINTVESQMSIAYRKLREELKDFYSVLLLFLILVK